MDSDIIEGSGYVLIVGSAGEVLAPRPLQSREIPAHADGQRRVLAYDGATIRVDDVSGVFVGGEERATRWGPVGGGAVTTPGLYRVEVTRHGDGHRASELRLVAL